MYSQNIQFLSDNFPVNLFVQALNVQKNKVGAKIHEVCFLSWFLQDPVLTGNISPNYNKQIILQTKDICF